MGCGRKSRLSGNGMKLKISRRNSTGIWNGVDNHWRDTFTIAGIEKQDEGMGIRSKKRCCCCLGVYYRPPRVPPCPFPNLNREGEKKLEMKVSSYKTLDKATLLTWTIKVVKWHQTMYKYLVIIFLHCKTNLMTRVNWLSHIVLRNGMHCFSDFFCVSNKSCM